MLVVRLGVGLTPAVELGRATAPVFLDMYPTALGAGRAPTASVAVPATGAGACTLASDPYSAVGGPFAYAFDLEGRATLTGDSLAALLPCYAVAAGATVGASSPRAVASLRTDGLLLVLPLAVMSVGNGGLWSIYGLVSRRQRVWGIVYVCVRVLRGEG